MDTCEAYLHNLYRVQPDFAYSVSRDFARSCQTPMLVMPDDTPSHSYEAAMDLVALAPKAEVTVYPWKMERGKGRTREDNKPGARLPSRASTRDHGPLRLAGGMSYDACLPRARGYPVDGTPKPFWGLLWGTPSAYFERTVVIT